jgi:hypothetical protein
VKTPRFVPKQKLGGRPPKFAEPSRPVTVTLPESTLSALQQVSPDRSRAIVELTKTTIGIAGAKKPLVEIVKIAKGTGVVIVGISRALGKIAFLRLVEVAPERYLLALEQGHGFHSLEIAIADALEDKQQEERENELLTQLHGHIKGLRRAKRTRIAEILFVTP